ncbi:hypothetical protein [Kribbella sp. NPDC023855]|uniref:hypothetical protein n=1 Tax=Kribbella sp. NPDC023855 TaxID=3154698 RepID=UPI0033E834EC
MPTPPATEDTPPPTKPAPHPATPPAIPLAPRPVTSLAPRPITPPEPTWAPTSCTLPTVEQPLREAEFDTLFAEAVTIIERPTPTTLDLTLTSTAEATARDLTTREASCCNFFTFNFHPATHNTLVLRIGVPQSATYIAILNAVEARARHQLNAQPRTN